MFRNNAMFNTFFKDNFDKNSIQQMYALYLISSGLTKKLTFLQFCIYLNLCKRGLISTKNKTFVVLGIVFFLKTPDLLTLNNLNSVAFIKKSSFVNLNYDTVNLIGFWKKFQKLKRPKTELNFNDYYLDMFKSKLQKYNSIGFLILFNSFYLVRSKFENSLKNFVQINKQLLVSPKYSSSTINKYLSVDSLQNFEFQFLRKNKVFFSKGGRN